MANVGLSPGALVAGRYRLELRLGEGGAGVVWAARDLTLDREVALKLLKPEATSDGVWQQRFLREARAAYGIRHPNVVRVDDVIEADGTLVIVMERLHGETLGTKLSRETRLGLGELCEIMVQVLAGVQAAHETGVVHRDLKPENIFLCEVSDPLRRVRILDFGLAKLLRSESTQSAGLTGTGAMLGTPYYMSPEQVFGERSLDQRTDIWSLGVILYECASGVRPTEASNVGQIFKRITRGDIVPLRALDPSLPVALTDLVARMLALDVAERPSSAAEVRSLIAGTDATRTTDIPVTRTGPPVAPDPVAPNTGSAWSKSSRQRRERVSRRLGIAMAALLLLALGAHALPSLAPNSPRTLPALLVKSSLRDRVRAAARVPFAEAPNDEVTPATAGAPEHPPSVTRQQAIPRTPSVEHRARRALPSRAQPAAASSSGRRPRSAEELFADPI